MLPTPTQALLARRKFIGGAAAATLLAVPGCASLGGGYDLTEAVRRLLVLSSDRAFARLASDGGYWDQSVQRIGLEGFLGSRGNVVSRILTSALFKDRLYAAFADISERASYRAAPIVTDAVRTIGFRNAIDLVRGGPTAATSYLRANLGAGLVQAIVPEVSQAMRVANEPLVGQLLSGLAGVDVAGVANSFSRRIDDAIWTEIGTEEANIRANPQATRDPAIIGIFGAARAL